MDEIDGFLQEDLGKRGDITSDALFTNETSHAFIRAKEACIIAGLEEARDVFQRRGAHSTMLVKDGSWVKIGKPVLEIQGPVRSILQGERLALNMLGRMSGIATETRRLVERVQRINPKVTVTATRKTTPGFRKYEKKAVLLGGGKSHRYGLYDAILIKDNHLKMIESVEEAIRRIRKKKRSIPIEIEVENESDALAAARLNVSVIMLDNFKAAAGKRTAAKIRRINPHILIEASGGITPKNIEKYAAFADRISLGYLTHSIKNIDFSLEIFKN